MKKKSKILHEATKQGLCSKELCKRAKKILKFLLINISLEAEKNYNI